MLFNEIETCRSTVTRKPKVDFQKRSTFDRNQNRPCDPIKETRGRSSKTHTFIHEMKMTRATVTHLRGVAGQNLRGFSMWHRTDRAPKKSRQLHRSILKKSTVAWFSTISKRAVRVYQGNGVSSVKNALLFNEIEIARASVSWIAVVEPPSRASVSVSWLGGKMARATVSGKRGVERQKHKVFNKNGNCPFESCVLERGRLSKTQYLLMI